MKTLSSLIILLGIVTISSAQTVPNASFENWHPYTLGEYPDFWTTSDSLAFGLSGGHSVTKDPDAYDGNFSIKMVSITTPFSISGPGVATNGIVTFGGSTFVFSGGTPDTSRARFFEGYYKYAPTNSLDAAVVKVFLLRDSAGTRDTVAQGMQEFSTASTWSKFTIMMVYDDYIAQPDTCLIILQSSRGINDPNLGVGSTFMVDSLGFSGFVGVDELKNNINSVNIYPSPANTELTIDIDFKNKMRMNFEIYDINGRLVKHGDMGDGKKQLDVSRLSNGKYILMLNDDQRNLVYNSTFSIAR